MSNMKVWACIFALIAKIRRYINRDSPQPKEVRTSATRLEAGAATGATDAGYWIVAGFVDWFIKRLSSADCRHVCRRAFLPAPRVHVY